MDLIDQKLSEKLKLFEYIDKKYGTNKDLTSEKTNSRLKKNNSNIDLNFQPFNNFNESENKSTSEYKTNSYQKYFYSPSISILDSNISKYDTKFPKKSTKKNLRNKSKNNFSALTAENSSTNTKRNIKRKHLPNDSGDRLYNYGYYIKNKLEEKRQKEEEKIRRQMTPQILNRSREMIKDKYRDPNKFEERLYYAERNNTNDSIYNRKRTFSKDKLDYNNNTFTYHPKINKKSLLIANKFKKINNNDMILNTSRMRMKNNNTNVTKNSKKFYPPNDSGNRLYNYDWQCQEPYCLGKYQRNKSGGFTY